MPFKYLSPLDLTIYILLGTIFLIGSELFPFLDLPVIFFTGFFSPLLGRSKTAIVLSFFLVIFVAQILQLPAFLDTLKNSFMMIFERLSLAFPEHFEKLDPTFWKLISMEVMIPLFLGMIMVIFLKGYAVGRKILNRFKNKNLV